MKVHIVMCLLEAGAHVDANDNHGYKAINFASGSSHIMSMRRIFYGRCGFRFENSQKILHCLRAITELLSLPHAYKVKSNPIGNNPVRCFRETLMGVELYEKLASIITPGRDPRTKTVGYIHTAADSTPRT
jgi:hypothetical protein